MVHFSQSKKLWWFYIWTKLECKWILSVWYYEGLSDNLWPYPSLPQSCCRSRPTLWWWTRLRNIVRPRSSATLSTEPFQPLTMAKDVSFPTYLLLWKNIKMFSQLIIASGKMIYSVIWFLPFKHALCNQWWLFNWHLTGSVRNTWTWLALSKVIQTSGVCRELCMFESSMFVLALFHHNWE